MHLDFDFSRLSRDAPRSDRDVAATRAMWLPPGIYSYQPIQTFAMVASGFDSTSYFDGQISSFDQPRAEGEYMWFDLANKDNFYIDAGNRLVQISSGRFATGGHQYDQIMFYSDAATSSDGTKDPLVCSITANDDGTVGARSSRYSLSSISQVSQTSTTDQQLRSMSTESSDGRAEEVSSSLTFKLSDTTLQDFGLSRNYG